MKQDFLPFYPFITHPTQADRLFTPPRSGLPTLYEQVEQQQCGIFMSDKNENTETALRRAYVLPYPRRLYNVLPLASVRAKATYSS